ncbi:DUF924 family protein [Caulobacter sp. 17J80-11]|uniref:DUF924 family protein n=1 Tax=Caulobacter sp. 17J80-11 TaxID=2763502 RepID=UPI001653C6F7|nr:DUF924 family protein [Caulobacter sp. 17J80-11]MBC6981065.1 DUF924 family protein [Caulobacter sp. 17J80-11]
MNATLSSERVLNFWREAGPSKWFRGGDAFDHACRQFEPAHFAAARRELDDWAETAEGALALLLLLDQFPRNLWRGSAHMWATDPLARTFAHRALDRGFDRSGPRDLRAFWYLPFQHSERLADHDRGLAAMADCGDDDTRWARHHREIIVRFGRFPHRNAALGRESTPEEQAYLADGGFSG